MSDDLADGPLSGRALLIEDNAIVALDTQDMLGAMGFVEKSHAVEYVVQLG